ncbi:hypothetical protein Tco_1519621, partial [Tanacetum coccineum]
SKHHSSLRFKLDGKSHTVNVDNFRDMLKICPKLPAQKFKEPPLEEDILSFIRDLGHTGEIKFLSNVNVNHMHQPLESLRLSRAQILWGMYHNKKVDYVESLWGDLVFHTYLTNQAMLESKTYMTYRAYATGEKTPKPKTTKKKADSESSPKTKSTQASKGKRITTLAKGDKPAKKKQSATKSKGLTVLSEVSLTEAQQMKIAIERSKIQTHSSHASGSGDGVDTYQGEDDEENDEHDSEDDNDEHDSENDNDDEDDDQENISG